MKPLLVEILESILRTDEKLAYAITCDEEELVNLTRDTSLACNQKESDEYVGMSNLDEGTIEFWNCSTEEEIENSETIDDYLGGIYWTNWNQGRERVCDYNTNKSLKVRETLDDWWRRYKFL